MIDIMNGNLQTKEATFTGTIFIDASDGDKLSVRMIELLKEIFEEASKGAIVIGVDPRSMDLNVSR